jgi:hypothetical protein
MHTAHLTTGSVRKQRLDAYRRDVEHLLGDRLAHALADDFVRFFLLVEACFEQEVDEVACARAWANHA